MRKAIWSVFIAVFLSFSASSAVQAQTTSPQPVRTAIPRATASSTPTATPTLEPTLVPTARPDLTQDSSESVEPLKQILEDQEVKSIWPANPLKIAIRNAIGVGVPANTIVLLLLLPGVAALIAAARNLIGLRGFGILIPAALSVVFLATGPIVGIGLFLMIVVSSMIARFILKKSKMRLQYLPRMAMLLWFVVIGILGVLFAAPIIRYPDIINVSIFPVLFLVLLAEDFTRVQLGKSFRTALNITTETLILSLLSYLLLTLKMFQEYVLLNPEIYLLSVAIFNIVVGRYVGLRFMEYWRFRKLIAK